MDKEMPQTGNKASGGREPADEDDGDDEDDVDW